MSVRQDVSPGTLTVDVDGDGVSVGYLDGRRVTYEGPLERPGKAVRCAPGREVHVLVTDGDVERGVMIYVNDRNTAKEILKTTGVGRVVLEPDEEDELVPGVVARLDGHAVEVVVDTSVVEGRVFVFEEDELGERAYELAEE